MPNGVPDVAAGQGPVAVGLVFRLGSFLAGLFSRGGGVRGPVQTEAQRDVRREAARARGAFEPRGVLAPPRSVLDPPTLFEIIGPPIPTPAEGGPPLVTERFRDLPGPFVAPEPLPVLQELGIPFPEPVSLPFQPGPVPVPDVPELEDPMAVDAPLLAGFAQVPARIGQVAVPTVTGFIGGLAQDIVSGLFARAPQEIGLGQVPVPARRPLTALQAERPSTRILRMIQNNTGVRVKLSSAKALIRQLGLQNGARCLGISVSDACTLIITPSPRRRRGISGSDIRIVKRTARRFQALQEDLSGLVSRRRAAPRRRKHVHAIAHVAPGG